MNRQKQLKMEQYQKMVQRVSPVSEMPLTMLRAFVVGGLICVLGQGISQLGMHFLGLDKASAGAFTSTVLIFLGAFLTGLGLYDKIGKFAGAGSVVPITGFANSVVAPAMEFKREGYITGVGARMFILAGPVLVYGNLAAVVVGILYFMFGR